MMFDLVNDERGFVNEGWENYRKMSWAPIQFAIRR